MLLLIYQKAMNSNRHWHCFGSFSLLLKLIVDICSMTFLWYQQQMADSFPLLSVRTLCSWHPVRHWSKCFVSQLWMLAMFPMAKWTCARLSLLMLKTLMTSFACSVCTRMTFCRGISHQKMSMFRSYFTSWREVQKSDRARQTFAGWNSCPCSSWSLVSWEQLTLLQRRTMWATYPMKDWLK